MRFNRKAIPGTLHSKRIVTKFLFWPKIITNEIRWLEFASWTERLESYTTFINAPSVWKEWIPVNWNNA